MFKRKAVQKPGHIFTATAKRMRATRWSKLDAASRHPWVVAIVVSALSVGVGAWVTHRLDQQQKQREATGKAFDALRAATDDLIGAEAEYQVRALHLRDQIVTPVNMQRYNETAHEYEAAYTNWVQRSAADGAVIEQMYALSPIAKTVIQYLGTFETASMNVDGCMRIYLAMPGLRFGIDHADVACAVGQPSAAVALGTRILQLAYCVRVFAASIRPDPSIDFMEKGPRNTWSQQALRMTTNSCPISSAGVLEPRY